MSLTIRKTLAALAFAAILLGGFQPFYLRIFTQNRARLAAMFIELPYRKLPGLRVFLLGVHDRTPERARIALWIPLHEWYRGYAYAYYRSVYLLAGRQVVPLLNERDEPLPMNFAQAEYVAAWGGEPQIPGFVPEWKSSAGVLYRRVK